jgi:hypothetical protein
VPTHATARRPAWARPLSIEHVMRKGRHTDLTPELAKRALATDRLYEQCLERGHQPSGQFVYRTVKAIPNSVRMEICAYCEVPWVSGR